MPFPFQLLYLGWLDIWDNLPDLAFFRTPPLQLAAKISFRQAPRVSLKHPHFKFEGGGGKPPRHCEESPGSETPEIPGGTVEEIRRTPVEVGTLYHYLQGFIYRRWCRFFSINTYQQYLLVMPDLFKENN